MMLIQYLNLFLHKFYSFSRIHYNTKKNIIYYKLNFNSYERFNYTFIIEKSIF